MQSCRTVEYIRVHVYFKALFGVTTINSRAASTEINKHATFDNPHCSPFVHMNIACTHMYIGINPLPGGKISRAADDLPESATTF